VNAVAERDQILQFLFGMTILIGTPITVVTLLIRGILKRRRAFVRWRECARRNGWSDGPAPALVSGLNQGLAWTLGVEGSDDDDIVWRARIMPGGAPLDPARLRATTEYAHVQLPAPVRDRFRLRDITFDADAGGISLSLTNRDLSCEDAEALIRYGLSIASGLTMAGRV
jgi:hypothetical protein